MVNILYAIIVLGVLGGVFGIVLAVASKVFAVDKDERLELIEASLPGANCGGCGYAGCSAYAQAIVENGAPTNACSAGGDSVAKKIANIMGVEQQNSEKKVALVRCSGGCNANKKFENYQGLHDCVAASKILGGNTQCSYACLGFGTCLSACKFEAISIINGVAIVNPEKCTGCMACSKVCPRNIIAPKPYGNNVYVPCHSIDKGADTRKYCTVGCIGCKICEKTCQFDAIHVENNLASIDYSKCTECGACIEKCPRKIISLIKH